MNTNNKNNRNLSKIEIREDYIGRDAVINKINDFITNLSSDKSLCLSLEGEWGQGKSFVIDKLYQKYNSNSSEFIAVRYDAWKNDFYDDPLIALIHCIIDALESQKNELTKIIQAFKNILNVYIYIGDTALSLATKGRSRIFLKWCKSIKTIATTKPKSLKDVDIFDAFSSYSKVITEMKLLINKLADKRKLIILVDEIDRCLPNYCLKIFEKLHYILDTKNTSVIVANNRKQMEKIINDCYGGNAKDYYKKIFDKELKLPTNHFTYIETYVQKIFTQYIVENRNIDEELINCTKKLIHSRKIHNIRDLTKQFEKCKDILDCFELKDLTDVFISLVLIITIDAYDSSGFKDSYNQNDNSVEGQVFAIQLQELNVHLRNTSGSTRTIHIQTSSSIPTSYTIVLYPSRKINTLQYGLLRYQNRNKETIEAIENIFAKEIEINENWLEMLSKFKDLLYSRNERLLS